MKLGRENAILRDSYNKLCNDLSSGEHVEMSWVKEAIEEAANCRMAKVYQNKISQLEAQLKNNTGDTNEI